MTKKKDEVQLQDGPHDGSSRTYTDSGVEPGPDVSNADVDLSAVSLDGAHATVVPAPEQNPEGHVPPPGPQYVQVLGSNAAIKESDEPVSAQVRQAPADSLDTLPEPELPKEETA